MSIFPSDRQGTKRFNVQVRKALTLFGALRWALVADVMRKFTHLVDNSYSLI